MKNKLCLAFALALLSFEAHALPQPAPASGNTIAIGGFSTTAVVMSPSVVSDGSNSLRWFTITAYGEVTNNNVNPFYKNGVAYQVTAGKTAKCYGMTAQTSAANSGFQVMYADATFANDATVASLTTPIYQAGATARYVQQVYSLVPSYFNKTFDFPAAKWPGVQGTSFSGTHVTMTCREI